MAHPSYRQSIIFREFCPALKRDVVLFRQTWEEHVLAEKPWLAGKLSLVRKAIKNCHSVSDIYQKIDKPKKIAFQTACDDFLPADRYLRVALEIKNSTLAIVTSAYSTDDYPKKGVKKYEPQEY